jgi:hypothetical protein
MSFRARLALVAAAAVALAVLTASLVVYFVVRDQLRSTVDDSLKTTAGQIRSSPAHDFEHFGTPAGELGGARVYPQVVDGNGRVYPTSSDAKIRLPVSGAVIAVARGKRGAFFNDVEVSGIHFRVLTFPYLFRSPDVQLGSEAPCRLSLAPKFDHSLGASEPVDPHCRRRNRDCGRARVGRGEPRSLRCADSLKRPRT